MVLTSVSIKSMPHRTTINKLCLKQKEEGTSVPFFFYFSQLAAVCYYLLLKPNTGPDLTLQ